VASATLVRPAHLWVPPHTRTYGQDVTDLAAQAGLILDGEQQIVLDATFAAHDNDQWAALEAAVICARQNLKTVCLEAGALADLFLFDVELALWTAHLFKTTNEAFRDIKALIENTDHLRRRCKKPREANGEQSIELLTGGRLLFIARSKTGGRGLAGADVVTCDEAFALSPAEIGSLMPTMSARPNPQIRYGSSAGLLTSKLLRAIRNRGRAGGDPSLAYVEWCSPVGGCQVDDCSHNFGVPGCVLDDESRWRQASPAAGRRISIDFIRKERRALPAAEFARERMGWWEDPLTEDDGIDADDWAACLGDDDPLPERATLAVHVNSDRSRSYIGGAAGDVVRLLHEQVGTHGLVEKVVELNVSNEPVVLDQYGQSGSLLLPLQKAGVELFLITSAQLGQATGDMRDAITGHTLRHAGEPSLTAAVEGAAFAPMGRDASKWVSRSALAEIGPLKVVTLARLGASAAEGEPFNIW
jgi:hypothetical protein